MSIRTERVAGEIQQAMSQVFRTEFSDLTDGLLTITKVRMAADLRSGRVYVSQLGGRTTPDQLLKKLKEVQPQIRHEVAKLVRMKFTPEYFFYYDDTQEEVARVEAIFAKIHRDLPAEDTSGSEEKSSPSNTSSDSEDW